LKLSRNNYPIICLAYYETKVLIFYKARINFSFVFIFLVSSPKGSYLSACLHYLALFGSTNTSATVIGNDEHGGLNNEDALLIQELAVDVWNKGYGWQYPDDSDCSLHIC